MDRTFRVKLDFDRGSGHVVLTAKDEWEAVHKAMDQHPSAYSAHLLCELPREVTP